MDIILCKTLIFYNLALSLLKFHIYTLERRKSNFRPFSRRRDLRRQVTRPWRRASRLDDDMAVVWHLRGIARRRPQVQKTHRARCQPVWHYWALLACAASTSVTVQCMHEHAGSWNARACGACKHGKPRFLPVDRPSWNTGLHAAASW
jgi:hypothetical protein